MINLVLIMEHSGDGSSNYLKIPAFSKFDMGRKAVIIAGERPDVKVVHPSHPWRRRDCSAEIGEIDATGNSFQQDLGGFLEQGPSAREHPEPDPDRDRGIDPLPAGGHDQNRAADHADRPEHVCPDFEVGSFDIEALILAG